MEGEGLAYVTVKIRGANGQTIEAVYEPFLVQSGYLERTPRSGLPRWRGELRSGFRTNLLMGVASNRVDVKQAAAKAERSLERLAEN